jgi:hypothetical protein
MVLARIIGDLGSEKTLIEELRNLGIRSLRSLTDVENHLDSSGSRIESLKDAERIRVHEEIEAMRSKHSEFTEERTQKRTKRLEFLTDKRDMLRRKLGEPKEDTRSPFKFVTQKYRRWRDTRRLRFLNERFGEEVDRPFKELTDQILDLKKRIDHLEDHVEDEVLRRLASHITEKESIDRALEQVGSWLIGARGEREVVLALAELPETFVIINDVVLQLDPPMKSPEGIRFKCQADHVVVGPPGVFNIETKYWSRKSIQSLNLRSPVEQIRLTGKALWRELNRAISNRQIRVKGHHWGDTSVRVRNILAMVGAMPNAEFQYVKILPINRLQGYLEYFEPVLQNQEVESITNWIS